MPRFYSMQGVRDANAKAGFHWFEPSTLRFFHSRPGRQLFGGAYFVSSEAFDPATSPRLYSIREAHEDGSITTAGAFQEYATGRAARNQAQWLAKVLEATEDGSAAGTAAGSCETAIPPLNGG